jgi:cytoskeletal protein RodZ
MPDRENNLGIGATLRGKREEKGITLEEAQENTFILKRYLEAIEEEKWNELPGKAYTIGYLKTYCRFLGLNPEPIIASFKEREKSERKIHQDFQKKPRSGVAGSKKMQMVRTFLFVCVVAALALGVMLVFYHYNSTMLPEQSTTVALQNVGNNTANNQNSETETETTVEESPPPPEPSVLSITLLPEDLAWVEVESEGKTIFQGILIPGKRYLLRSVTPITVAGRGGNRVKFVDQSGNEGYLAENSGEFARSFTP